MTRLSLHHLLFIPHSLYLSSSPHTDLFLHLQLIFLPPLSLISVFSRFLYLHSFDFFCLKLFLLLFLSFYLFFSFRFKSCFLSHSAHKTDLLENHKWTFTCHFLPPDALLWTLEVFTPRTEAKTSRYRVVRTDFSSRGQSDWSSGQFSLNSTGRTWFEFRPILTDGFFVLSVECSSRTWLLPQPS
jgi:hypothetical protein